jgi:hypothetical protein
MHGCTHNCAHAKADGDHTRLTRSSQKANIKTRTNTNNTKKVNLTDHSNTNTHTYTHTHRTFFNLNHHPVSHQWDGGIPHAGLRCRLRRLQWLRRLQRLNRCLRRPRNYVITLSFDSITRLLSKTNTYAWMHTQLRSRKSRRGSHTTNTIEPESKHINTYEHK